LVGTDVSSGFTKICREREGEVFTADSLSLPVRTGAFDHAISIAVIHHFSNDAMRIRAISELLRIVKPGGTVLIYVWAFE
jgi:SAM-dependent methyltransferase